MDRCHLTFYQRLPSSNRPISKYLARQGLQRNVFCTSSYSFIYTKEWIQESLNQNHFNWARRPYMDIKYFCKDWVYICCHNTRRKRINTHALMLFFDGMCMYAKNYAAGFFFNTAMSCVPWYVCKFIRVYLVHWL